MKKIGFLSLMMLLFAFAQGQNYNGIKTQLTLGQFVQAKTELEKQWSNAKFVSKPEAYMLRAAIFAALAAEDNAIKTAQGKQYLEEAVTSFNKYREMDPKMDLLEDPIYQNAPINIYSALYGAGFEEYQAKNWEKSFQTFQKVLDYSDLLIGRKILAVTIDTNALVMAGVTAENAGQEDAAANYYRKLADIKLASDGFESVYRFLVSYSYRQKDMAAFEKYKAIGKELYPDSEFFTYDQIDFAIGLSTSFDEKMRALEAVLANDPNNYKANQVMGEIIYDTLNSREETDPPHSNEADLEKKMAAAFVKAAAAQPDNELAWIYTGDHFINKAVRINKAREKHAAEMKARTKPGTMASKEDVATRDELDRQYGEALESARPAYEKAAAIYAVKPKDADENQALRDKTQYKKIASYLADIYAFKKNQAKAAADKAKYAAEEKKWNERWDSIK